MGGGGNSLSPQGDQMIQANLPSFVQDSHQLRNNANAAANGVNTNFTQHAPKLDNNFMQFNPNLSTEFAGPKFSSGLDAFSQNLLSKGLNDVRAQRATQDAQIQRQFGSTNPNVAAILKSQGAMTSAMNTNPLLFEAGANQRAREGQEFQLGQQSQALTNAARLSQGQELARLLSLGNQSRLQQTEASAGLQGLQNSSIAQRLQMQATPSLASGNLLKVLSELGILSGFGQGGAGPSGFEKAMNTVNDSNIKNVSGSGSLGSAGGIYGGLAADQLGGVGSTAAAVANPYGYAAKSLWDLIF
jgi:hypothetical protein